MTAALTAAHAMILGLIAVMFLTVCPRPAAACGAAAGCAVDERAYRGHEANSEDRGGPNRLLGAADWSAANAGFRARTGERNETFEAPPRDATG